MGEFLLDLGNRRIAWGTHLDLQEATSPVPDGTEVRSTGHGGEWEWDLAAGVYRAEDIVRETGILLEAIREQLGAAEKTDALLNNLEATLDVQGREASLPLGALELSDTARIGFATQAAAIGKQLVRWARKFARERHALKRYGADSLRRLVFRSHCDRYLWTPETARLLMGTYGGPNVMQLFNEYLHQIVLLRDALIPFENWEEVPIELGVRSTRGLRYTEKGHSDFIADVLTKPVRHHAIVRYAQKVLAPKLKPIGYGFQYRWGTILPASLGGTLDTAAAKSHLLRWYPVRTIDVGEADETVSFAYAHTDYYSAERSIISETATTHGQEPAGIGTASITEARLVAGEVKEHAATIAYRIRLGDQTFDVDLGQSFRGERFLYRPVADFAGEAMDEEVQKVDVRHANVTPILGLPGLVTGEGGTYLVDTGKNELVRRALLGKLYPENTVLLERMDHAHIRAAQHAGKGFGAKFLLH